MGVKTPIGGKIAEVLFKDGVMVEKGQPLVRFDTRQAQAERTTSKKLIELERADLEDKIKILESRKEVLKKKLETSVNITNELKQLVKEGGFERIQYLRQLDGLYELRNQLNNVQLEKTEPN